MLLITLMFLVEKKKLTKASSCSASNANLIRLPNYNMHESRKSKLFRFEHLNFHLLASPKRKCTNHEDAAGRFFDVNVLTVAKAHNVDFVIAL